MKRFSSHALRKVSILETFIRGKSNIRKVVDANPIWFLLNIKTNRIELAH